MAHSATKYTDFTTALFALKIQKCYSAASFNIASVVHRRTITAFSSPMFMKLITSLSTIVVICTEFCLDRAKIAKYSRLFSYALNT